MPLPHIVGNVDCLGYFRCIDCHAPNLDETPVYSDNCAFDAEGCDMCGRIVVKRRPATVRAV